MTKTQYKNFIRLSKKEIIVETVGEWTVVIDQYGTMAIATRVSKLPGVLEYMGARIMTKDASGPAKTIMNTIADRLSLGYAPTSTWATLHNGTTEIMAVLSESADAPGTTIICPNKWDVFAGGVHYAKGGTNAVLIKMGPEEWGFVMPVNPGKYSPAQAALQAIADGWRAGK